MLADTLNEPIEFTYPGPRKIKQNQVMKPFLKRLSEAKVFCLDRDATAMAAHVSLSKPSSTLSALEFARLPAQKTWIEFVNDDLRNAMADLGSPNIKPLNSMTTIIRSGFLMWEENGRLVMDYAHLDKTGDGRYVHDLSPVRLFFDLTSDEPEPHSVRNSSGMIPLTKGRLREFYRLLSKDPAEAAANASIRARFTWMPHPDWTEVAADLTTVMGQEKVYEIEENQADDASRTFALQILPGLILINCKNAIAEEGVTPSAKLNKNRSAKGKAPLRSYTLLKMHLTSARKRTAAAGGEFARMVRAALVIGHFKVRKNGIFWWSPHARRGYGEAVHARTVVTP